MEYMIVIMAFGLPALAIFLFLWPFLVWSHLREQTRSLEAIKEVVLEFHENAGTKNQPQGS